jgi:hypothetical protein
MAATSAEVEVEVEVRWRRENLLWNQKNTNVKRVVKFKTAKA